MKPRFHWLRTEAAIDLAVLVGGQVLVKGIVLCGTMAAIRALGPNELGAAAHVMVAAGILSMLLHLGIDTVGPRLLSSAPTVCERGRLAVALLVFRAKWAGVGLVILPIYALVREPGGISIEGVSIGLVGGLVLIANSLNPQFILQGYGCVRRLALPQVASAAVTLIGNLAVAMFTRNAVAFLLVQAVSALLYAALALAPLRLASYRTHFMGSNELWRKLRDAHALSAWGANAGSYIFGQGDALVVSALCSTWILGEFNGALSIVNGTNSFLILVPTVLYARQLDWKRLGHEVFYTRQSVLLKVAVCFAGATALLALIFAPSAAALLLGDGFEHAPVIFGALFALALLNIPYALMVGAVNACGRTRANTKVTTTIALISFLVYPSGVVVFGMYGAVWAKGVLLVVMTALQYIVYRQTLGAVQPGERIFEEMYVGESIAVSISNKR